MTSDTIGSTETFPLDDYLSIRRERVEKKLDELLPDNSKGHPALIEAMRYALMGGGKRFRPILTLASCEAAGGDWEDALEPACAVEFVHAYSLVHDDLPAMDDAIMRRGREACHRKYGEALGILAGDGLLTEAWGVVSRWSAQKTDRCGAAVEIIRLLAQGAGLEGMVSGQAYDMDENGPADIKALDKLHGLKTGALIGASISIGAVIAGADGRTMEKLSRYADAVGLAFQVVDDILDVEGEETGKDSGADAASGKRSYPVLAGMEGARRKAESLVEKAIVALEGLPGPAEPMAAIARYAIERKK